MPEILVRSWTRREVLLFPIYKLHDCEFRAEIYTQ